MDDSGGAAGGGGAETMEQMQARHRREAKELQGRVTNKKKNATKKTRKGVNDECAEMERQMKERQAGELEVLMGGGGGQDEDDDAQDDEYGRQDNIETLEDLSGKIQGMGFDGYVAKQPPPPPPQQPSSSSKQPPEDEEDGRTPAASGGKKKRNRQKERLARRAAEQEAAAEAAEQEAAGMTDHRGRERERMTAEFARHGLEEHEIRPDGHCLFSAVADQLGLAGVSLSLSGDGSTTATKGKEEEEEPGYKTVRRAAAGYIGSHGDEYAGFLEEDVGSYVRKIRDTAEWGGQLELLALASVYGVEVCVVQDGRTEVIQPSGGGNGDEEGRKKIWLAYYRHGYGLGEHYNSLRQKAQVVG
jgi:OTU domain-containing protein 6